MTDIIVSVITGVLTLVGVIITVLASSRKQASDARVEQAVIRNEIQALTREVREHNNFARRMPVLEEQIKVINHRISDLEEAKKHE